VTLADIKIPWVHPIATGLLEQVEAVIQEEQSFQPNRTIYLMGQGYGALLALLLAAHNPDLDLVLVLVDPGGENSFPLPYFTPVSQFPSKLIYVSFCIWGVCSVLYLFLGVYCAIPLFFNFFILSFS
jgi:pimeloyl-ACP methyl ester carboxylesterase